MTFETFPGGGVAVVIGASGGLGSALLELARNSGRFDEVIAVSRDGDVSLDLNDEASIAAAAEAVGARDEPLRLAFDATGFLHRDERMPEKSWRELDAEALMENFAVNAIGPALLMKHFLPLLPRREKAVFATLSARVGSIGDNGLGGWYGYRAAKAALNQFVRTAAIELKRSRPDAACLALHPGTVKTSLSAPFQKSGLNVRESEEAARDLAEVLDRATSEWSGGFFDHKGERISW